MVKLRLRRAGKKAHPIYKIVAADSRAPRNGRFIEIVGDYNPGINPAKISIVEDRALYWLKSGAQPTDTVKNLLSRKGTLLKFHLMKKGADETKIAEEYNKWLSLQDGKIQRESEKKLKLKEKRKAKKTEAPAKTTEPSPAAETTSEAAPAE